MSSVNKVILIGNVGQDPEVKHLTNGKVANIVIYGKLVDIVEQYVKKGDKLYIEGSITTRKWQDKEGNDRYNTEVKAFNMTMLGGTEKRSTQPEAVAAGGEDDLPF